MQALDLDDLFEQLLLHRDRTIDLSSLGPWLQHRIANGSFPNLNHIPLITQAYTRHYIAKEPSEHKGFEALIMRWDKHVKTSIHGHPAFSFYHVISGVFEMELFVVEGQDRLHLKDIQRFYPSDTTWCLGQCGRYDNFIHRVTCLEAGLTFHVYSDDAQKGISL